MKWTKSITDAFKGMMASINRFPLTVLFLVGVALLNSLMIENTDLDYTRLVFTFGAGAMFSGVGQMLYERFFKNKTVRYGLMAGAIVLTVGYYFAVGPQYEVDTVIVLKTSVTLFALFIAFIWIPSIDNEAVPFHRSFLSAVKAFFISLLFSLVLAGGISAIYSAADYLLFDINPDILGHLLNVVASLFAPIYFLSLTPNYSGEKDKTVIDGSRPEQKELLHEQFVVPRFFEILISYIVIPILAVYTLILVVYVVLNITGEFWTNNLLEPLLVSYAIIVIIVLILSYNLENRLAVLFRRIFPEVLIPIVVFQTVASVLKIRETGITHGRYYVILFGIFATIVGLVFSFMKSKYHGYIAAVLLVFAAVSIVPPIDAFTISRKNQIGILEETLRANEMLEGNQIKPNENVPTEDRITITRTATYISDMGYSESVDFLPAKFNVYNDFSQTFGFRQTYPAVDSPGTQMQYVYLNREEALALPLEDADALILQMLAYDEMQPTETVDPVSFTVNNETYQLEQVLINTYYTLAVKNAAGEELISYNLEEVYQTIFGDLPANEIRETGLDLEEATFTKENEQVKLTLIVSSLEQGDAYSRIEFYLFVDLK